MPTLAINQLPKGVQSAGGDARKSTRSQVQGRVVVSGGRAPVGSRLFDISLGGAAVVYPPRLDHSCNFMDIGDEVVLVLGGRAQLPGRVVRLFDGGFAVAFDWSMEVERDVIIRSIYG